MMSKIICLTVLLCQVFLSAAEFTESDCVLDVHYQPACRAHITVYKWDDESQKCVVGIYGGCHPTNNNFKTEEECDRYATPICSKERLQAGFETEDCVKDVEEGPIHCFARIPVFKWDQKQQKCVSAIYGGCSATRNNFKNLADCEKYAAPVCQRNFAIHDFEVDDCFRGVEDGPIHCKAYKPVYKWDQEQGKCIQAIYGGCHATNNNFPTEEECQKYAAPICKHEAVKSVFQVEDCVKDVEEGPIRCFAMIPVFKWDQDKQRCVRAIYGGCRATHNNFKTMKGCQKNAAPVCQNKLVERSFEVEDCVKDVQEGSIGCFALIPVYKWDDETQKCVAAIYGGCNPSRNNFETIEECQKFAAPVCLNTLTDHTFEIDDCEKDVEEGPIHCFAHIPVYKYDQKQKKCVQAFYGGCHATNNNFQTEEECQRYAVPVCQQQQSLGEREFAKEDCVKEVEWGPVSCDAYIPVFKWDTVQQKCVRAIYGGCRPTNNNFESLEDCVKYAAPVCKQ